MNLYKMTKEELVALCKRLQKENDTLCKELDNLSNCYTELECKIGGENRGMVQRLR